MLRIELTEAQRAELGSLRDHDRRPYLRERAAAILKVAGAQSPVAVACSGLLRPRHRVTVEGWVRRFQQHGVAGLVHRPRGGGRPPGAKDKAPRKRRPRRVPRQDRPDP